MHSFSLHRLGWASLAALGLLLVLSLPGFAQQGEDQETIELGAKLFAENCAVCHGPDGQGRVGATLDKNWPSVRPDLQIETTIRNGIPGSPMPAWSQAKGGPLSDDEINALVTYILTWETGGPPLVFPTPTAGTHPVLTPPPGVSGDPNQGAVLFDQNCAVCHGVNGEGRIGARLAKDWPSIRPDLEIEATIQRGIPGSAMPAWSQENGGPLTKEQIDHVVSYILTWETAAGAPGGVEEPQPAQPAASSPLIWGIVILVFLGLIGVIVYFSSKSSQQS